MKIEIAGFGFSDKPTSRPGSVFMTDEETGEGTEIDESILEYTLRKLFAEVM